MNEGSIDENLCRVADFVWTCPEVFEMPEAISIVKTQNISGDLIEKVKEAVESCPVEAIIIEE